MTPKKDDRKLKNRFLLVVIAIVIDVSIIGIWLDLTRDTNYFMNIAELAIAISTLFLAIYIYINWKGEHTKKVALEDVLECQKRLSDYVASNFRFYDQLKYDLKSDGEISDSAFNDLYKSYLEFRTHLQSLDARHYYFENKSAELEIEKILKSSARLKERANKTYNFYKDERHRKYIALTRGIPNKVIEQKAERVEKVWRIVNSKLSNLKSYIK